MTRTYLLDVNVLLALLWPTHAHHRAAHTWFRTRRRSRWATCPLTELAFVRLASNPSLTPDALTPGNALSLLRLNLQHPEHEFWPDALPLVDATEPMSQRIQGHRQLNDVYLLALASRHRAGVLASFDGGVEQIATPALESHLEIIPTGEA